jgi:predicted Zn-dependent peptidase
MSFHHHTLNNGLTLLAETRPSAVSTAVGFFVRTGSRDEPAEWSGVSHFLEHMLFKGSARRSAEQLNIAFDQMGADYNAYTSEETTVYYGAVLPEFQDRLVELLADMMQPALRKEDFQTEKNVILDEIALYDDQPAYRLYDKLMNHYFADHPLANEVLGSAESIRALDVESMRTYFRRRYTPASVTVVAAGQVDVNRLVASVEAGCGHWAPAQAGRPTPPAPRNTDARVLCDPQLARQHIGLMSPAPDARDDARYAAGLWATIFGDTAGSRLYYALVETALADEAHTTYSALDGAGGLLTLMSTRPDRASEAVDTVRRELKRFSDEGPSEAELTAAVNKIASGATLRGEVPMGRLSAVGYDWMYRSQYRTLADELARIEAVTVSDIQAISRRFQPADTALLTLGPRESL